MATSTCVKCGKQAFEVKETTPSQSNYRLMFVQCSSCGGVAGVLDYYNLGALLKTQEKTLGAVEKDISSVKTSLRTLEASVKRLAK
jgi:hypothetical protein